MKDGATIPCGPSNVQLKIAERTGDAAEATMRGNDLTASSYDRDQRDELASSRRAIRDRRKLHIAYQIQNFAC